MDEREVFGSLSIDSLIMFARQHARLALALSVTGIGLLGLRRYCNGGVCRSTTSLVGKTVIITGANTGIGKETAIDLAGRGAKVILACRDITKAERAAASIIEKTGNKDVSVKILDLASLKSVRSFVEDVKQTESQLDILINNAGIMACPHWKTEEGYEMQFGVNHLGHFLLTNLLLDLLKKSAPSRIVNVSSAAHMSGEINIDDVNSEKTKYSSFKAYGQSKLANVLFTRELHKRLQGTGVSVFSLHPGIVNTELDRHLCDVGLPRVLYYVLYAIGVPLLFKSPKQGAQTSIYCAVEEGLEKQSGNYFSDCALKTPSPRAKDDDMASKLWGLSEEMVGLTWQK